ncbi:hypothetical protein [Nitrosomonas sp. Nm166]|uniref:hypothetical protein n=1 Tax=Nitrosomonas sp. Nm166 TaxID=1881054 RepID=UPI0008EDF87C|nr:hypothetical protein [Nitrosomonas sp. Nm166]SFE89839.1 hypothetical protein SAMN05428977_10359 [Nitrosomonas sp. Nm166]
MGYFLLLAWLSIIAASASANDLGVSISIGQPGFYGQINLGSHYPRPQLIYPDPILARPAVVAIQQQPIYLHVPPGHAKKWNKHCYRYNACNQSVYFIDGDWYNNVYLPHYHSQNNYPDRHYNSARHHDNDDRGQKRSERRDKVRRQLDEDHQGQPNSYDHPQRGNDKHWEKHAPGRNYDKKEDRYNRRD